ncbi:MAG: hypothetical protein QOE56_20 [Solirubrobacterales bacterium]|nr:hypothetical protein [Solirubrobacterales bacterium]
MAPWKLPLLVIAIAVPTIAAFYIGGPGVGVAIGALAAVAIVVVAVRARPRGAIGEAPSAVSRRRLLVIVACPVEDAGVIARIAAEAGGEDGDPAEVLVLAPARIGFLDRWASDLEGARRQAQQNLVITVASLAKAGVAAEARVGDEDLVQAVEDAVGSYAATEVILVTAEEEDDPTAASAATELESRLRAPFLHLRVSDPAAR